MVIKNNIIIESYIGIIIYKNSLFGYYRNIIKFLKDFGII